MGRLASEILSLLKKEISEIEYKRYIKQLTFNTEHSKSDYAVFLAPNPLIASWVRTKYSEKIAHLFEVKTSIKPQVVVEVRFNEIQESSQYRSGLALRFARISNIREDKSVAEADTIETLQALYAQQFEYKGQLT